MDSERISIRIDDPQAYEELRGPYLAQLSLPMDDMWMAFSDGARPVALRVADRRVGCAAIDDEGRILRFHLEPQEHIRSLEFLRALVEGSTAKRLIVSTGDPLALSTALEWGRGIRVDTLLYELALEPVGPALEGLAWAEPADHGRIVDFQHGEVGAPRGFLESYVGERIERREMLLDGDGVVLRAVGELRRDRQQPGVGHLGLIVRGDARGNGVGSSMMASLVHRCREEGLRPQCSTEVGNFGARRAIERAGLRARHRLLEVGGSTRSPGERVGPAS